MGVLPCSCGYLCISGGGKVSDSLMKDLCWIVKGWKEQWLLLSFWSFYGIINGFRWVWGYWNIHLIVVGCDVAQLVAYTVNRGDACIVLGRKKLF